MLPPGVAGGDAGEGDAACAGVPGATMGLGGLAAEMGGPGLADMSPGPGLNSSLWKVSGTRTTPSGETVPFGGEGPACAARDESRSAQHEQKQTNEGHTSRRSMREHDIRQLRACVACCCCCAAVALTRSRACSQGRVLFVVVLRLCVVFLIGSVASAESYPRAPPLRRGRRQHSRTDSVGRRTAASTGGRERREQWGTRVSE